MTRSLVKFSFCFSFILTIATFVVLCIVWTNLAEIKDKFDDILDKYHKKDSKIYTKISNDFWGPVTIICDENSWELYNSDVNITNISQQHIRRLARLQGYLLDFNDTSVNNGTISNSYCDDYISSNYSSMDSLSQYWSLYYLTTPHYRNGNEDINDFKALRQYVYVYAIFVVITFLLTFCCVSQKGFVASHDGLESKSLIFLAMQIFFLGLSLSIYGLIMCNCLSIIPITDDTQGNIIILEYIPAIGLIYAYLAMSIINGCKNSCNSNQSTETGKKISKFVCPIVETANLIFFTIPIFGFSTYLVDWINKFPYLIDDYMNIDINSSNEIISDNYIDKTKYLTQLGFILCIIAWAQCGVAIFLCFIACCCNEESNRLVARRERYAQF